MRQPKPFFRSFNATWYDQVGKKQIPLAKGHDSEAEAWRRYHEVMAEQGNGRLAAPLPNATVSGLCGSFLDWSKANNAENTYEWYRTFLLDFCEHAGKMKITDIIPDHVTRWLSRHPRWKGAKRCGITAVKRAFNWAFAGGLISENPLRNIRKPPSKSRDRVLSAEERQQIFDNYRESDPFRDFLIAMQETGARPGEVSRVTANHVDLDAGIWEFREHKTASKTGQNRVIILTPTMVELSKRLMERYPEGPLFRNKRGTGWNRHAIRCRFRSIRKKLGLGGDLVSYLYRHSFATDALENGVGVAQVAELLGHTSTDMVMRHYQHLSQKREHLREQVIKATRKPSSEHA